MKSLLSVTVAGLLMVSAPALAQTDQAAPPTQAAITAAGFVEAAGTSNLFEITSSELALERGKAAAVKAFAQQMIADHTKAGKDLAAVLARGKSGLTVPRALDARHKALVETLTKAESGQFDREYVRMQVQAHQEAVALSTAYAEQGDDADLKAFAAKTLPVLRHHYDEIRQIAGGS